MPFAKRIVEPQLLCRHPIPNDEDFLFEDLCSINNVALSRTLRQLSDLAKHACSLFQELENEIISTNQRVWILQNKIGKMQQTAGALDPKLEAVPLSNLDQESKLTSHYQAPWHQQHNVFHPCTRPPCVEDLHRHAKQNLRPLHRDQQQRQRSTSRERRVTISISVAPPMPTFPSPRTLRQREQRGRHAQPERPSKETEYQHVPRKERTVRESEIQTIQRKEKPVIETEFQPVSRKFDRSHPSSTVCCYLIPWRRKTAPPTDPDSETMTLGQRPKCPVPNVPSKLDKQTNWSKALPLPTPEERMKTESQVISSCIIPINVTGVSFDREASARCSLVHSQSVLQRRRKLRRRKTITGIPRRVQQDMDSDESPVARERTVIIHPNPQLSLCRDELSIGSRLNTKDSGCQTDDFLIAAPSRRRIRAQRAQGIPSALSHSTGNISSLPDHSDTMYASTSGGRLRSRSLPREGGRLRDEEQDDMDDDDDEDDDEELSPYEAEDFLPGPGQRIQKDEEESTDDQAMPELQLGSLKRGTPRTMSPDHGWLERGRSRLPRKADMGSCEISSSSDTFSSPIHSVSTTGVLGGQIDHKEDHQSSSGNWSGSSSTCPSQTSETLPPAASPPLTGSSHCDSELSLNTAPHVIDDTTGFIIDPYQSEHVQTHGHRSSSFTSSATDQMDDAGVSTASEGEWNYVQDQQDQDQSCTQDFSPRRSREDQGNLQCSNYVATYEGFSGKAHEAKGDTNYPDTEGLYTSMHFDMHYNYAADCDPGSNLVPRGGEYPHSEHRGTRMIGRHCLSLRKPKAKPPPPKRSSSLKESSRGVDMPDENEPKMLSSALSLPLSSREMKLELDLGASEGQTEILGLMDEPHGAWGVESCREVADASPFCSSDTHSFKDDGAVQSDYADLWLLNDLRSSDPYRSLSNSSTATGTTVIECIKSPESSESHTSHSGSRPTSPSLHPADNDYKLSSPEKLASLASPSSGYSSQSETPTSSFPSAFFPNPLSPTSGKRKPKVPERKSSLSSHHQQHLGLRDAGCSTRRDAELLAIPPPQPDLSALRSVPAKPPAYRSHILYHNKQKAAAAAAAAIAAAAAADPSTSAAAHPDASFVDPVFRSVQLRSTCKMSEKSTWDLDQDGGGGTLVKCSTVTSYSDNRGPHSVKPVTYRSHDAPAQEFSEPGLSSGETTATQPESIRHRQQRHVPGTYWAMTAFRTPVEFTGDDDDQIPQSVQAQELQGDPDCMALGDNTRHGEDKEEHGCLGFKTSGNVPMEPPLPLNQPEPDHDIARSPPVRGETTRCDFVLCSSPDKVPARPLEASHTYSISDVRRKEEAYETLGIQARSASQDNQDESSTPDTEDYFSKESTPSDSSISPLLDDTKPDDDGIFPGPNRLRTTEDLFAMIHRSKRKVLGRKDSGELCVKSRVATSGVSITATNPVMSPASPGTPTTPTGSQRAPGPIYRSAKKSSTSNEEFKLLLLKKGSRTDSSYRMSATEILKSPITPKTPGELLLEGDKPPEEPPSPQQESPTGPETQPSPQYPKANTEGFSPKTLSMTASSRQGRSRIPPAANSSRYSTRSRLYTAPMQAISEGETENSDGSPHDDRSS
ncbi:Nance-Horan syndrome protein isoform X2 [Denticeps clupeoides]|uniref:Nance-Horan syndrome protein isoform X2 n=1 Tax=Denticeps clupeoides TaxID=299321 RepID=UPI0010A2FA1D|nr:Nance-Horan syndrome protein-like isoform X2 [Denticeps clupeoides]